MAKSLIIVESAAKTRTIGQFLGREFRLEASLGHVRDLPKSGLGVDIQHDFRPKYLTLKERSPVLHRLSEAMGKADQVYLATDPDREGEAIAWHLAQALKIRDPRRIEFNEITRRAVTEALRHPRGIDMKRVDAQQARRILDRLVGYTLSPLLQKKLRKRGLSAGRVQSVAVKLICDREREIQAFVPEEYWDLTAHVTPSELEDLFAAKLVAKDGAKIRIQDVDQARQAADAIWEAPLRVVRVKTTRQLRRPPPPFTTSTLQQDAANRLGFSARQTMRVAQALYEGVELAGEHLGLITYMRTDSTRVAAEAVAAARETIAREFGDSYLPEAPPRYPSGRGAQEAHEAIRPTAPARTPDEVAAILTDEAQVKLYRLVWSRFMASQMSAQHLEITVIDISAGPYLLRARGVHVLFPGFAVVYPTREREVTLPEVKEGTWLDLLALASEQKFTEPPPRYTEATLVRALEAKGIGRPSTYAPIIGTIQERGYVYLEHKKFHPTDLGFVVTDQLVAHFPDIMDVEFTAGMETKLDLIEEGNADWVRTLREFYTPFEKALARAESAMQHVSVQAAQTDEICDKCGSAMLLRVGRRGPFLACSGYPQCRNTRPAPGSEAPSGGGRRRAAAEPTGQTCGKCGSPMVIRAGRRGRFLACSAFPKCRSTRPLPEEEAAAAAAAGNQMCELCGRPMVMRRSRFGPFLGCSGYPECKGLRRLARAAGEPAEGAGERGAPPPETAAAGEE